MNIGKGYKALITILIKSVFIRCVLSNEDLLVTDVVMSFMYNVTYIYTIYE